jgi:hypothetical protein
VEPKHAIDAGLRFLEASQAEEGCWSDWNLPLGESRMWTTAYTGFRLSSIPQPIQHLLLPAASWLLKSELRGGGWGYNEEAGPDADSTALAILFLTSQGAPVPIQSYDRLRSFQKKEGGFSTYTLEQSYGAWTSAHPDVTAMAIPALLTLYEPDADFIALAAAYVLAQATPEGLWNSYWWNTPLYATEANLRWLAQTHHPRPANGARDALLRMRPENAFEMALLLQCLLHTGCDDAKATATKLASALVDRQLSDGSWASQPILRLPPRDCYQPWIAPETAPLFADQNRIFTSVTVIASLCLLA